MLHHGQPPRTASQRIAMRGAARYMNPVQPHSPYSAMITAPVNLASPAPPRPAHGQPGERGRDPSQAEPSPGGAGRGGAAVPLEAGNLHTRAGGARKGIASIWTPAGASGPPFRRGKIQIIPEAARPVSAQPQPVPVYRPTTLLHTTGQRAAHCPNSTTARG